MLKFNYPLAKNAFRSSHKGVRKAFFICYNMLMEYITVVIDSFWAIMQQITVVIVPIIAILLIFTVVKGLLFNDR